MINLTQDLHLVQENCIPFKYLNKMEKKPTLWIFFLLNIKIPQFYQYKEMINARLRNMKTIVI